MHPNIYSLSRGRGQNDCLNRLTAHIDGLGAKTAYELAVDGLLLKRTHFVWDGTRLLQEYAYKGSYTYIYTDQDGYEPLAQVFHNNQDEAQYLSYFHNDQIDIPREMTDIHGNLVWLGLHFDPDLLNRITRVMGAMSEGVRKELERWEFCVE